jgi:Cobalamin synthesis G C-terminus
MTIAMAEWFAVGVGLASAADPAEVAALVDETLRTAGIPRDRVRVVATVDTRAAHPALAPLEWPIVAYSPSALATAAADLQTRPSASPSDSATTPTLAPSPDTATATAPTTATGRPPVAEPAALLAAGPGAALVVSKRRSARVTVAVAAAGLYLRVRPC